ncbi:MAG: hypothetical protein J6X31_07745 [Bacteroidales bacterium]|nr:hypothetical protein [Bacteroidales bacterium]
MNENTIEELRAWQDDARHELTRELDRLDEKRAQIESSMKALDATDELLAEIDNLNRKVEHLNEECESTRRLLQEEKDRSQTLEMRLSELTKLSAGVAKKSSQDELLKALRTFVNKSKHKRMEKRAAIKEMVLELANANGIILPEDLAASIDALDDDDTKPVSVSGDYVVNKNVGYEVNGVASGATGMSISK